MWTRSGPTRPSLNRRFQAISDIISEVLTAFRRASSCRATSASDWAEAAAAQIRTNATAMLRIAKDFICRILRPPDPAVKVGHNIYRVAAGRAIAAARYRHSRQDRARIVEVSAFVTITSTVRRLPRAP